MLAKQNIETTASYTLHGIQGLGLKYAEAPNLVGSSPQDQNSAVWLAATAIARDANYPISILIIAISVKLIDGLVAINLANRIKILEAALQT